MTFGGPRDHTVKSNGLGVSGLGMSSSELWTPQLQEQSKRRQYINSLGWVDRVVNDSVYTRGRNALSAAMMSNGGGVCRNAQMQTLFAVIDNTSRVTLNHAFLDVPNEVTTTMSTPRSALYARLSQCVLLHYVTNGTVCERIAVRCYILGLGINGVVDACAAIQVTTRGVRSMCTQSIVISATPHAPPHCSTKTIDNAKFDKDGIIRWRVMLRQLLSSGGGGGGAGVKVERVYPSRDLTVAPLQPHPNEVLVKNEEGEKNLAVLSNMPPIAYYPQLQSTPAVMVGYPADELNDHISGTTELFSSTFAMLSGDSTMLDPEWAYQQEKPACQTDAAYSFGNNAVQVQDNSQVYINQPLRIAQHSFPEIESYGGAYVNGVHEVITDEGRMQQAHNGDYGRQTVSVGSQIRKKETSRTSRASQAHCISFRDIAEIPLSSGRDTPGGDGESDGDERVMCMACRGVYPSRRSLTGHIGRNEKCREIIGRSYLGQLNGATKVSIPGTSGAPTPPDTLSPICPYCDRFISHYKGNIRRHVNQCMKSTKPKKKKSRRKISSSRNIKGLSLASSSSTPQTPMDCFGDGSFLPGGSQSNDAFYDGYQPHALSNEEWMCAFDESVSPTLQLSTAETLEIKGPDDPYLCSLCDFVTLYRGNMKRHLSTCHNLAEEDFQDGGLDSLRASRCAENSELLQNRVCKGRRAKIALEAYDGKKRLKMEVEESNEQADAASAVSLTAVGDRVSSIKPELKDSNKRSNVPLSCGSSTADAGASGVGNVGSRECESSSSQQEGMSAERRLSSSDGQYEERERSEHLSTHDMSNADAGEDTNDTRPGTSSTSNIDEIINAVASNQLGSPARKPMKVGNSGRSSLRRSRLPKTVRNMEEVRGYWEAERLNSGVALLMSSSLSGRSRSANFAGVSKPEKARTYLCQLTAVSDEDAHCTSNIKTYPFTL
uniref:C2H2-type domain-containing protein n=1 Tax=Ascaris lumbricoides TaxID=6252 RepID=A0A9J2PXZ2_ASCLU